MATIAFIPYPETGHVNASFKLAKTLRSRKHQVSYVGLPDFEDSILLQNSGFFRIFETLFPKGNLYEQVADGGVEAFEAMLSRANLTGQSADVPSELARFVRDTRPSLFIIDLLLPSFAYLVRQWDIPVILLNTNFHDPWNEATPLYQTLLDVPELVLCPEGFDFPRARKRQNSFFVEASIDEGRKEVPFPWNKLLMDKQLVYCSLGSQSHLINGSGRVLRTIVDAISQRDDWQLVLATGSHLAPDDFGPVARNIVIVRVAPQLDLLRRASIMITHGGFNTVKECIFFGVPMVLFPLIRDHPAVAARVVHHGLGMRGNIRKISVNLVLSLLDQVSGDPSFRIRVQQMGQEFRELEEAGRAIEIVESVLSGQPPYQIAGSGS
jgi:UDP:flavonoid glycosyltransferase YjiC (YdhE family)